jgi:hypothetical protein
LPFINVPPGAITTYKANSFDGWMITYSIDCRYCSMNHIQDAVGEALIKKTILHKARQSLDIPQTSLLAEFSKDHGGTRIAFGGLEDQSITGYRSHRNRP